MWPNSQFPADLVTFIEEIINGKFFVQWNKTPQGSNSIYTVKRMW